MGEYIKICQQTLNRGIDFTTCNVHLGQSLVIEDYNIQYLAEKFSCIFGALDEKSLDKLLATIKAKSISDLQEDQLEGELAYASK